MIGGPYEDIPSGTGMEQRPGRNYRSGCVNKPEHLERDIEMQVMNLVNRFAKDEDGAVTVDWVVLTAAIVGLGLIVMAAIKPAISNLSTSIAAEIEAADDEF
ncbi:hypothetical protein MASR1M32_17340 [Rhodobacter sp.]